METDISLDDHPSGHCVIPVFVPIKTFFRNKTPSKVHLVPLKTFLRNQISSFGSTWLMRKEI